MPRIPPSAYGLAVTLIALLPAPSASGGDSIADIVGLTDLIARVGERNVPSGAGVIVGMPEASPAGTIDYSPDRARIEFLGKTFSLMNGPSSPSGHATTVALLFYGADDGSGESTSIAPGVGDIYLYKASGWTQNSYLKANSSGFIHPASPPQGLRIFNNSWIGSFGQITLDQAVLRRADFCVNRDQVLIVNGVNNATGPGDNPPFMSHMFNGIAVGRLNGPHQSNPTAAPYDGAGRMKPEIVAPGDFTSFATPVVSAACALMLETAAGLSAAAGSGADRSEVVKAVILAGAAKRPGWTNNPQTEGPSRGVTDTPIDSVWGVDTLNVNTSHMIMTGGAHAASPEPPTRGQVAPAGWSLASVAIDGSAFYRVSLPRRAAEATFLITWHRRVQVPFGDANWSDADLDLFLWRQDGSGDLISLVGDEGLGFFAGGNVVSESPVDNLEHLHVNGLGPGDYVLEVRRQDQILSEPTWDVAAAWILPPLPEGVPGDVNGDTFVNVQDLVAVILAWGPCAGCPEDLNGEGLVDVLDLVEVILSWS